MLLTFKEQFVQSINNGTKIHTIREDSKDRWKEGMKIHFWKGNPRNVSKKPYPLVMLEKDSVVKSIEHIFITWNGYQIEVSVGDDHYCHCYLYKRSFVELLAKNDGFESLGAFEKFFYEAIQQKPITQRHISGKIIHWTDFSYQKLVEDSLNAK